MTNRIGRKLVGMALAASMLLPAPLAAAGVGDRQGDSIHAPEVIQVDGGHGYRYWRDDDRRDRYRDDRYRYRDDRHSRDDHYRYRHRDDRYRYRDDRHGDWRYSERYRDERRHDHRHKHRRKKGHDHDAAPFIFGGIALGTILLLNAIEHDRRRR